MDRIEDQGNAGEELLNRMVLRQLLDSLDEKESRIIRLRYFEERTQTRWRRSLHDPGTGFQNGKNGF